MQSVRMELSFVEVLMPIVRDLKEKKSSSTRQWSLSGTEPSLSGVLKNGYVAEEDGRPLTVAEWQEMWRAAAAGERPELGFRQRYMIENMRLAIAHLGEIEQILAGMLRDEDSLSRQIEALVLANLPARAQLPDTITLLLGTCSGGFVDEQGRIVVDLAAVHMLAADPGAVLQFLAHETWHSGHWSLLADDPRMQEPWFMAFPQLQSEGMVNHLIGGTYKLMSIAAQTGQGETQKRAQEFLHYADTLEACAETRMSEYLECLDALFSGDSGPYEAYVRTLPDAPGYLHGVLMAKAIADSFGRQALIETASDPVRFLLAAIESFQRKGFTLCTPEQVLRFSAAVR